MSTGELVDERKVDEPKKVLTAEELAAKKQRQAAELAAEKAEVWQSISALYIPLSLFLSCVSFSAGAFLLYNYQEPAGWGFIVLTAVIALSAFVALFRFQNKFRAQGIVGGKDTEMVKPTAHHAQVETKNINEPSSVEEQVEEQVEEVQE